MEVVVAQLLDVYLGPILAEIYCAIHGGDMCAVREILSNLRGGARGCW